MSADVLQSIYQLADRLSKADVTADAIATSLGTIRRRVLSQVEVDPASDMFAAITVVHKFESPVPNHVRLTLAEPIDVDSFTAFFGPPLHELDTTTDPPTLQFLVDANHVDHVTRIIAHIAGQQIQTIELVRNIRLG